MDTLSATRMTFIDTQDARQLKPSLFNAIVAPRPIGWISTVDAHGRANLAPFSYFNGISPAPPMVMFTCNAPPDRTEKDTVANVRVVPEFVVNFVSFAQRDAMNMSSATVPAEHDEFELAGLQALPSHSVRPPRVAGAPAHLECRLVRIVDIEPQGPGERRSSLVIGRVVGVHVDERYLGPEQRFDTVLANPLVRLGGFTYATVGQTMEIGRPQWPG
ncbi:Flavin reductase like domain protein [Variovorax sp. PBS-H4]|uniref:flavin reductase family protein n=1 Tax=Variovorax sp. PBS-H4 TaxID=434008 RepID=UPI00131758E0|nr:flavin reductase family protein [Variovorax sp. PBS-H4]VTU22918.1 Flavin reductase like domain protein [Variovorax sp. PBS-H4]